MKYVIISMLAIGFCGCWKIPVLKITPRDPTAEEIKHAITQLPEGFRDALPDTNPAQAARLDLNVWAFDFEGGPFNLIIETIGAESNDKVNMREPRLRCEGERGRLLIWLQPRDSSKMAPELRDRFRPNKPQVPNLVVGIDSNDQQTLRATTSFGSRDKPLVPLWFGWKRADVHESKSPATLKVGEVASILRLEATEKDVEKPRKIILSFQAAK
jgi:hypothetical protein